MPEATHRAGLVVLYDRDCGLCVATARRLGRRDRAGRLELLPLQAAAASGRPVLERVAAGHDLHAELHVVDEATGSVRSGGAALAEIVGRLPGGRPVAALVRVPPLAWLLGLGYALVARNRHAIGRALRLEGSCPVGLELRPPR
jgi:predicted DCC family thiol-disulfide oxidoreductase YuxK